MMVDLVVFFIILMSLIELQTNLLCCLSYRVHAKPNQTLFIIGANRGNGLAAIQIGKAYGLKVFASVGCPNGILKAREFGADHVVDHT